MFRIATLVAIAACACSPDEIDTFESPSLDPSPPQFAFGPLAAGESSDRAIELRNTGAGTARLAGLRATLSPGLTLFWQAHGDPREYVAVDADGEHHFPTVIEIPPGGQVRFIANFAPRADGAEPSGTLRFISNDGREHTLPIVGDATRKEIHVSPRDVDLGRIPVGEVAEAEIFVTSVGTAALKLGPPRINGSDGFAVSGAVERPLRPGQVLPLTIRYAASHEGPASAELVLESDDPVTPTVIVDLSANGASPCVSVRPAAVEFPAALVGRTTTRPLWVESCGGEPLHVSGVRLVDSDGVFEVEAEPFELPAFDPGGEPAGAELPVRFSPRSEQVHRGQLVLETNDPANPSVTVPIVGRGVHNACPIPHPGVRDRTVRVLDPVYLDASMSTDPDGPDAQLSYNWTLVEQPQGGVARVIERPWALNDPAAEGPDDDDATPTAFLWPTLVGRYVAELRATDALGVSAPSPMCGDTDALVVIDAIATGEIHVQLTWDTPGDDDQTDQTGTDVDLHVRHADGFWDEAPLDCYFGNPHPDWGPAGPAGDPDLDIDDVNGAGPENTRIEDPEVTGARGYRIGVHYFRDMDFGSGEGFGASIATVRVFFGGVLAAEYVHRLERTDDFWEVADVFWGPDGGRLQALP